MPTATITVNGVQVELSGTPAELASITSLLVEPGARAKAQPEVETPEGYKLLGTFTTDAPKAAPEAPKRQSRKAGTKTTPKAGPKIERKLPELGDGPRALTKQTRRSFGKALKRLGDLDEAIVAELKLGEDPEHWSTKELATYAMATETVPAGYKVAGGYYQLVGPAAKAARENAVKALKAPKQAPKGRVRDSKGRFVKS